jgi:hypothetical protein
MNETSLLFTSSVTGPFSTHSRASAGENSGQITATGMS